MLCYCTLETSSPIKYKYKDDKLSIGIFIWRAYCSGVRMQQLCVNESGAELLMNNNKVCAALLLQNGIFAVSTLAVFLQLFYY